MDRRTERRETDLPTAAARRAAGRGPPVGRVRALPGPRFLARSPGRPGDDLRLGAAGRRRPGPHRPAADLVADHPDFAGHETTSNLDRQHPAQPPVRAPGAGRSEPEGLRAVDVGGGVGGPRRDPPGPGSPPRRTRSLGHGARAASPSQGARRSSLSSARPKATRRPSTIRTPSMPGAAVSSRTWRCGRGVQLLSRGRAGPDGGPGGHRRRDQRLPGLRLAPDFVALACRTTCTAARAGWTRSGPPPRRGPRKRIPETDRTRRARRARGVRDAAGLREPRTGAPGARPVARTRDHPTTCRGSATGGTAGRHRWEPSRHRGRGEHGRAGRRRLPAVSRWWSRTGAPRRRRTGRAWAPGCARSGFCPTSARTSWPWRPGSAADRQARRAWGAGARRLPAQPHRDRAAHPVAELLAGDGWDRWLEQSLGRLATPRPPMKTRAHKPRGRRLVTYHIDTAAGVVDEPQHHRDARARGRYR